MQKIFLWGFYCTNDFEQAKKWANRNREEAIVNYYSYTENKELKILEFGWVVRFYCGL